MRTPQSVYLNEQVEDLKSSLRSAKSKLEHVQQSIGPQSKSTPLRNIQESNTISRVLSASFYHEVINLMMVMNRFSEVIYLHASSTVWTERELFENC